MSFIPTMIITLLTITALTPVLIGVYRIIQLLKLYKSMKWKTFLSACPLIAQICLAFYIFDVDHLLNPKIFYSLGGPIELIIPLFPIIYLSTLIMNFAFFIYKNPELL